MWPTTTTRPTLTDNAVFRPVLGERQADLWRRAVLHAPAVSRDLAGIGVAVGHSSMRRLQSPGRALRAGARRASRSSTAIHNIPSRRSVRTPAVVDYDDCPSIMAAMARSGGDRAQARDIIDTGTMLCSIGGDHYVTGRY